MPGDVSVKYSYIDLMGFPEYEYVDSWYVVMMNLKSNDLVVLNYASYSVYTDEWNKFSVLKGDVIKLKTEYNPKNMIDLKILVNMHENYVPKFIAPFQYFSKN